MSNYIKIFCLLAFIIDYSIAQFDSSLIVSNKSLNELRTGFEKNLNTFKWMGIVSYYKNFDKFEFNLSENFISNLIKTTKKLFRDEQLLEISGNYKVNQKLKLSNRFSSFLVSDNLETGMSNINSNSFFSGIEYTPFDFITIEPALGFRTDKQMGEYDSGISYYFKFAIPDFEIQGYNNQLNAFYQRDNLSPRKLETRYIYFLNKKMFAENTYNILNISYKNFRRDFYFSSDSTLQAQYLIRNNIENRRENLITLNDSLNYNLGNKIYFSTAGNIIYRIVDKSIKYKSARDFDNQIKDLKIFGSTNVSFYISRILSGNVEISYGERNVTHTLSYEEGRDILIYDKLKNIEIQKNNYTRRTTISGNLFITINKSNKLFLSSSNSILRYDTPSKLNDDDRDELWTSHSITTYHRLNKYLNLQFNIDANLVHIVYLFNTRSANNNWNRILKFSPKIEYSLEDKFISTNIAEVIANYTTFDFESADIPLKSYLFRQFAFIDSSRLKVTDKLNITFFNKIILYERGQLNWRAFKSKPSNFNYDGTFIYQIQQRYNTNLLLSLGIRYFIQKRYKYVGRDRHLENLLTSVGPIASIDYVLSPDFSLAINGWSENIKYTNTKPQFNTNILLNLNRRF
ncbi:MAG: hypothetical protein IGBAC_1533 [Ignavibacteriae bacterium]|nr:MAG: hypothetical protein IGBAC_1533 [Ignavibacteriota bacterium]